MQEEGGVVGPKANTGWGKKNTQDQDSLSLSKIPHAIRHGHASTKQLQNTSAWQAGVSGSKQVNVTWTSGPCVHKAVCALTSPQVGLMPS